MSKRQSNKLKFRTCLSVFNPQKTNFNFHKPKFIFTIKDLVHMYFIYSGFTEKITPVLKVKISEEINSNKDWKMFENFLKNYVIFCFQNNQMPSLNQIINLYLNKEAISKTKKLEKILIFNESSHFYEQAA